MYEFSPETTITLLQISDIHINSERHFAVPRFPAVANAVAPYIVGPLGVIVSGDITFGGTAHEFDVAKHAFESLEGRLRVSDITPLGWALVPGNHDGTFKTASKNRSYAIQGLLREGEAGVDDSVIDTCTEPLEHFFNFQHAFPALGRQVFGDKLLSVHEVVINEKIVSIWSFNVSWMSQVPEQQGKLVFPVRRYQHLLQRSASHRIAVLHHPLNWYAQDSYHSFRELLLSHFCTVLTGHEHVANGHTVTNVLGEGSTVMLSAGAFGPHSGAERSEFGLLRIDVDAGLLSQQVFVWSDQSAAFIEDPAQRTEAPISVTSQRAFEPTEEMKERVEEIGAPFAHPTREKLRLSDVYIEPQVKCFSQENSENIAATSLLEKAEIGLNLLHGDDHFGKTSFLQQAFQIALRRGLVPVLAGTRDIGYGSDSSRERKLLELITSQYGAQAQEKYLATPKSKRLLLVDDFDRLPANEDAYEKTLHFITAQFSNIVLTVNERFDTAMLGSPAVASLLASFEEYHLAGFSYVMRTQLIEKWYSLDRTIDRASFDQKVHEAQDHLDAAVGRALIPSTAFNTLMILQAREATQKSQVIDAGIAQHYDLLIRRRLLESGAQAKHVDGLYAYLGELAWWLRDRGLLVADRSELESFNQHFSVKVYPIDLGKQLDLLLRARILQSSDSAYKFRYPSARYFFLAHYIAENIEEDERLRGVVQHACRHLYIKENANLIVFLTNKSASKWIVKEVAEVLKNLLSTVKPLNVVSDARQLNDWIVSTTRVAMESELGTGKNRHDQRQRDEEAAKTEEANLESEEVADVSHLDVFAQLNLVFKTSEILGLILKSRYGSLNSQLKDDLLTELFDGPLRAVSWFLEIINGQPDTLVQALASFWREKLPQLNEEQRRKLAQKYIFQSVGAYSLALLLRQGSIIGSPELTHAFRQIQDRTESEERAGKLSVGTSLTYRLVCASNRLSYPGDIPHSDIERLARDLKNNPFGFHLLQGMVANHLYMFPVKFDTRQKLAEVAGIDLRKQVAKDSMQQDEKLTQNSRGFQQRNPKSLIQRLSASYFSRNSRIFKRLEERTARKSEAETPTLDSEGASDKIQ